MKTTQITALAGVALLVLAGCGDNDDTTESADATQEATDAPVVPEDVDEIEAAEIEAQWEEDQREDPWENIPDDAPIHDMTEEDMARAFLDCEDDESLEECEQRYQEGVDEMFLESEVESCQQYIESDGFAPGGCFSSQMTNEEFYVIYEERTGEAVPAEFQEPDPTCDELNKRHREAVVDHDKSPDSTTAEWAVESAEDQIALYGCEVEGAENAQGNGSTDSRFADCDEAWLYWGGLMNDELDGIDASDEIAEVEEWKSANECY